MPERVEEHYRKINVLTEIRVETPHILIDVFILIIFGEDYRS
jgi:hypothetical protein